jgi:pimeloyl-ACP methyl ester carboxylesterase
MKPVRAYTNGQFGQIHYATAGKGVPLLLCHQSPTNMCQFDKVVPLLVAHGFQVITADLPGYGRSDGPDHVPTMEEYSHIVPAVLDAAGVSKADVLGHHTGAVLATDAALQFPERFNRLVLNGPLPLNDDERAFFKAHLAAEKEWGPVEDGSHLVTQWNFRMAAQPGWTDLDAIHKHVVQGMAAGPHVWYAHDAVMAYDHGAAMLKLTLPCLVYSNTGDSIHHLAERATQQNPRFDYAQIEGGTFDILDEQPENWVQPVIDWLQK